MPLSCQDREPHRVSILLIHWPCLRHRSSSVKKAEQVTAQFFGGVTGALARLCTACSRAAVGWMSWCSPALEPTQPLPGSTRRAVWQTPANSKSCKSSSKSQQFNSKASGRAWPRRSRVCGLAPSLPCGHWMLPPDREPAVAGTARQQPGRFVPEHICACLMVGVCFFLLTLIIIVTPSIDTQTARRNNKECSVPNYSLSTG